MPSIRHEESADQPHIHRLVSAAFAGAAHSNGREQDLVDALRAEGALSLSLVAEYQGQLAGHIMFSAVSLLTTETPQEGWFGLAPLAVLPELQGRGIGRALVESGLVALRSAGARGCVVLGDPAYYGRFGFRPLPGLWLADVPSEYFLALSFDERPWPQAEVRYHPVFARLD